MSQTNPENNEVKKETNEDKDQKNKNNYIKENESIDEDKEIEDDEDKEIEDEEDFDKKMYELGYDRADELYVMIKFFLLTNNLI